MSQHQGKDRYEQWINNDLEWLSKMPDSAQKMHIEEVLKRSIEDRFPEERPPARGQVAERKLLLIREIVKGYDRWASKIDAIESILDVKLPDEERPTLEVKIHEARSKGFFGIPCNNCGAFTLKLDGSGPDYKCETCGCKEVKSAPIVCMTDNSRADAAEAGGFRRTACAHCGAYRLPYGEAPCRCRNCGMEALV